MGIANSPIRSNADGLDKDRGNVPEASSRDDVVKRASLNHRMSDLNGQMGIANSPMRSSFNSLDQDRGIVPKMSSRGEVPNGMSPDSRMPKINTQIGNENGFDKSIADGLGSDQEFVPETSSRGDAVNGTPPNSRSIASDPVRSNANSLDQDRGIVPKTSSRGQVENGTHPNSRTSGVNTHIDIANGLVKPNANPLGKDQDIVPETTSHGDVVNGASTNFRLSDSTTQIDNANGAIKSNVNRLNEDRRGMFPEQTSEIDAVNEISPISRIPDSTTQIDIANIPTDKDGGIVPETSSRDGAVNEASPNFRIAGSTPQIEIANGPNQWNVNHIDKDGGILLGPSSTVEVINETSPNYNKPASGTNLGDQFDQFDPAMSNTPPTLPHTNEPKPGTNMSSTTSSARHLDTDQGGAVTDVDKNKIRSRPYSPDTLIGDMVRDSYHGSEKTPGVLDISGGLSPWGVSHKLPATARKESREGGDGPDKIRQTEGPTFAAFQPLNLTPYAGNLTSNAGNLTSNAGGEEDQEAVQMTPKASGMAVSKPELPEAESNVVVVEGGTKSPAGDAAAKPTKQDEENDTGEQNKENPCPEVLSECMRKWGRPKCGRNFSFMPNLDPPCCKSPCAYQTSAAVEATTDEGGKEDPKEESKAMKCNYTGFTDTKQSELEALIDKHVSYLRCTQGQSAAIPKQTNFISSAPDPYSQMCKDLAFKSSAGLFNQSINKEMYSSLDICRDPCPKLPPLCGPPPSCPNFCQPACYRDPCPKLPKLCCSPPSCNDPCFPAPCCTKLPNIGKTPSCFPDPCSKFPRSNLDCPNPCLKPCSPPKCFVDLCTKRLEPCSPPLYCVDPCDPCDARQSKDPCLSMRKPCIPRSYCIDPFLSCPKPCSSPPCYVDPCTGLSKPRSPRTSCRDPCTGYFKLCSPPPPCSPRPICKDPCMDFPKSCSPRPSCIDPCAGFPMSRNSRSCCIDPCTGMSKPCSSSPSCIDPCTGLSKQLSPRLSCINPCTGLPKLCADPCSINTIPCKPYPSFSKQYRIDPITRLPILCGPSNRLRSCLDPCDILSTLSCNSASDTKLSCFKEPQDSMLPFRPCLPPRIRPCSGSLSFLAGKSGPVSRRRSSSLDHFKGLQHRRAGSQDLAKKIQCVESKWSGIKQRACEVMNQIAKLQQEACCPTPQPCPSYCANPFGSPICDPCPSPIINPCSSPICKPCLSPPCAPHESPICNPCISPRCFSAQPLCKKPQAVCCLYKCTPMCLEDNNGMSSSLRKNFSCVPTRTCCPTSNIRTTTVCCNCDKQTSVTCRSACNQTSEFGRRPGSRCSTSCAQLNESSNKKSQVGSTNNFAEISTDVGPSLMGPPIPRKRGRSEKRCTIMRLGKCDEVGQTRDPNTNTDVSCCSTQAEGGKIAEIAKFVKECFDDTALSAAANRPVVKIRYNKGAKNYCPNPCQDSHLKEQIAKAIRKGKEIQKKNSEKHGKNANGPRSRTVLRFKSSKNSQGNCEIYNVQLEDDNPDLAKRDSLRKRKTEYADESNLEKEGKTSQQNLGVHQKRPSRETKYPSSEPDDIEGRGSQQDFNQCHQEIVSTPNHDNPCLDKDKLLESCNEQKLNRLLQEEENTCLKSKENTNVECPDLTGIVLNRKAFPHPEKESTPKENSDACVVECKESCVSNSAVSDALKSADSSCIEQSNENDMNCCQHHLSQQGTDDHQSNTNENANSEQFGKDGDDKIVTGQIPGVLTGQKAYSYDLSKYDHGINAEEVGPHNFVYDMFIDSSESEVDKFKAAGGRKKWRGVQSFHSKSTVLRDNTIDTPVVYVSNSTYNFWSPKAREIRKRCLYLDDPSWEAFEYIGAHVFSLPTSYPSGREHLHKTCDDSSNKKAETKSVKQRHVFLKSRYTNCGNPAKSLHTTRKEEEPFTKQGKLSKTLVPEGKYEDSKTKSQRKAESPITLQYGSTQNSHTSKNATNAKALGVSADTVSHTTTFHPHNYRISEENIKHQQNKQDTEICTGTPAERCLKRIPEEVGSVCSSLHNGTNLAEMHCQLMVPTNKDCCDEHEFGTTGGAQIRNCNELVSQTYFSTEGSEGSTHGIEDLPLDTESLSRQMDSMTDKQTITPACGFGSKSTVSSQNNILYAGDYVEVCSSAPFQNKTLTPKYHRIPRDKQNQSQQGSVKKAIKPFLQVQKKVKQLKFRIMPLNEGISGENTFDRDNFKELQLQKNALGSVSRLNSEVAPSDLDGVKPVSDSLRNLSPDFRVQHGGKKLSSGPEIQFNFTTHPTQWQHSRRHFFSEDPLRKPEHEMCPQNTDMFEMCDHQVVETPLKPTLTFPTQRHAFDNDNFTRPASIGCVDLTEQGVNSFPSKILASNDPFSFNEPTRGERMIELLRTPITTNNLDAQTMTGQSATSMHQRDKAIQVMLKTMKSQRSSLGEESISEECLIPSTAHLPQKEQLDLESFEGGDAWSTLQVGCAEVTQASQNRVVLQGAYVQQLKDVPPSSHETFKTGNMRVIPFRLMFLKTSGTDQKKLSLEGIYSRLHLDSPRAGLESWTFQV